MLARVIRGATLIVVAGLGLACGKGLMGNEEGTSCKQGYASNGTTCARVCVSDFDCRDEPGMRCELNLCVAPIHADCTKAADCTTPGPCKMLDRTRCEGAQCIYVDCAPGYDCVDRACVLRAGVGESCQSTAGCKAGLTCGAGVCCDASQGGCCTSDSDCAHNLACNKTTSSCEVTCRDGESVDCADPARQVCMGGGCVTKSAPGQTCSTDAECGSGHCAPAATGRVCCDKPCDGLCEMCGNNGVCDQAPPDDPGCVVSCEAFSTSCRKYPDVMANRCESHGKCKSPTAAVCAAYVDQSTSTVCRPAAGPCDTPDHCDGVGSCGADGVRRAGEVCRQALKGADGASCDTAEVCDGTSVGCPGDKYEAAGAVCRAAVTSADGKTCDVAETCSGTSPACPANVLAQVGTVCRAKSGDCDVEESCSGTSGACPADTRAPATQLCRSAAGVCDIAELCDGVGAACPADAKESAPKVCRPAVVGADGMTCDVAERCDGTGNDCPGDGFAVASTVCRAAVVGVDGTTCDAAETCSGTSAVCPGDGARAVGAVCRAPAGACDAAEKCNGTAKVCPGDGKVAQGVVCRGAVSVCDVGEACDGMGDQCPADAKASLGTHCGNAGDPLQCDAQDTCDGNGGCVDNKTSGNVCLAGDGVCRLDTVCDGVNKGCPLTRRASGTQCGPPLRPGACALDQACNDQGNCVEQLVAGGVRCHVGTGECDVDAFCPGNDPVCPSGHLDSTHTCGSPKTGDCDLPDTCDGAGGCAARLVAAGTVCHLDNGTGCDSQTTCDGQSKNCPPSFKPVNDPCGGTPAGECDLPNSCDGNGSCVDRVRDAGYTCRSSTGVCDVAEACDGQTKACPADLFAPTTTWCGNTCKAGWCEGTSAACVYGALTPDGTPCGATECQQCKSGTCAAASGSTCTPPGGGCGRCSGTVCTVLVCSGNTVCCKSATPPACLLPAACYF